MCVVGSAGNIAAHGLAAQIAGRPAGNPGAWRTGGRESDPWFDRLDRRARWGSAPAPSSPSECDCKQLVKLAGAQRLELRDAVDYIGVAAG